MHTNRNAHALLVLTEEYGNFEVILPTSQGR